MESVEKSPLDIPGFKVDITRDEIVAIIREMRTPMNEPVLDFEALDDLVVGPPPKQTKEELARLNTITSAWFKTRRAVKALEAAEKHANEMATHLARLIAIDEMEKAKKKARRRRAATTKTKEVCTA